MKPRVSGALTSMLYPTCRSTDDGRATAQGLQPVYRGAKWCRECSVHCITPGLATTAADIDVLSKALNELR
ncbi:hypothetical protein [Pseudomonas sp. HLT2-19-2]